MVHVIFGTRPELIKMAPVIHELDKRGISFKIVSTGQHREMLAPLLKWFAIEPDYDLAIMKKNQSINGIIHNSILELEKIFLKDNPNFVLVQGDTTTAFVAALAAFNNKIKIGHIEAGLRTNNIYNPFPEEANRRLICQIATLHFAPTPNSFQNLQHDGIDSEQIYNTGNTVIDALYYTVDKLSGHNFLDTSLIEKISKYNEKVITITGHRRENIGEGFENIFNAIKKSALRYSSFLFVYPVHLNPLVKEVANRILGEVDNILLIEPLDYPAFVQLMKLSHFMISDSGGVQEEAPSLGIPVLVTRKTTERIEAVEAGTVELVGDNAEYIYTAICQLMDNKDKFKKMSAAINPYGDGTAAKKIIDVLESYD
ncbi:non-hydrolyzing UDP-N-acetylglucosamine 2-epimerase [Pontibacter litorisediminis]|uniref:non-hydrolyzing UDP-N-acetylglucosamine 2-epimerase n=1 Tax=Pontibacter litorisediminis TaxID=1846260 RepID=UPI0023EC2D0E|nr:UDP-N-acetylglucosamine 2-epimerase (non-hydrolyzing) [Pontibacter litorisediminis]